MQKLAFLSGSIEVFFFIVAHFEFQAKKNKTKSSEFSIQKVNLIVLCFFVAENGHWQSRTDK